MSATTVQTKQIRDANVTRADLNTATTGLAVITKALAGTGLSSSFSGADTGTGDVTLSVDTSAIFPLVDTTTIVKGSSDGTKKLRFEVDGLTTATTRTVTVQDYDGTMALWEAPNVFNTVQTINTGANGTSLVDGLVLANTQVTSGGLTTSQYAPSIVFECHQYSSSLVDKKIEMVESFRPSASIGGGSEEARFSWLFSVDNAAYVEKSYIDSSGSAGFDKYVSAGFIFVVTNGLGGAIQSSLAANQLLFAAPSSSIFCNDTGGPLFFDSQGTTNSLFQFRTKSSGSTSGTLVELFSRNTFTGKYIDIGVSGGASRFSLTDTVMTFSPAARTSGTTPYLTINMPADTSLTTTVEAIGVNIVGATRQHASGAISLQREWVFGAPTYSATGLTTITTAVNVDIADPAAGSNLTFTNKYSLRASNVLFIGTFTHTPTARSSGAVAYLTINAPADTAQTAGSESIGVNFIGAIRQHASNTTVATQREWVISAPTYSFASATGTITTAITMDIADPVQGTNATLTNIYSLRAANVLFTGVIKAGSGPTTLTDSAGKILSAALNTVAVAQGGTGLTTAAIASFNAITGYTASGATGLTSSNLVFSAGPTFTGVVAAARTVITYGTGGGAPLEINVTTSGTFVSSLDMIAASITAGQQVQFTMGHDASTNNRGYMSFYYAGSGSANNNVTWGFYGADNTMNHFPSGGLFLGNSSISDPGTCSINLGSSSGVIKINGTQVVKARITGWAAWTGTADRTTHNADGPATVTQLGQALKALLDDLRTHGLIGT